MIKDTPLSTSIIFNLKIENSAYFNYFVGISNPKNAQINQSIKNHLKLLGK